MWKRLLFTLTVAVAYSHAAVDPVTVWNTVAGRAFAPTQGTNPVGQSRTYAILHASIHDTLNAIDSRYRSYTPGLPQDSGASAAAAIAAASRLVLTTLIPDQSDLISAAYTSELAAIPDGPAKARGIALGETVAQLTLRRREQDGADRSGDPVFLPRTGPGEYQFTEPFNFAAFPGWGRVTPFAIVLKEHELDGPLSVSSARYARDFQLVKEIGRLDSRTRTAEQSEIARFWYEDSPLGWNRITSVVVRCKGLDPWQAARAFALVNFAIADAYIAGFDAKYQFRFWRPITAIQNAGTDGNDRTEPDTGWQPFQVSPPVPDYPSTHSLVGAAAAEVLIDLFGDRIRFETTSSTLPGVSRSFRDFSEAAEENGESRVFSGIHFPHAVRDGLRQGRGIGRAVGKLLPPVCKSSFE
ncbi:vanadium-dependent haloperoxidase [uncultured Paludibaculum sp.]|uniref:vanadium-dependent haloperoxidase n=1 Tax=uncultured Paludibaculum sp. TaxID=1765020 RepID=UPI002AAB3AF5|nr:vanadium-dependent haloperoxidase [uncultured Paludibaculum sp.]